MKDEELQQFPESVRDWDEIKNSDTPEVAWDRLAHMRSKMGTAIFTPSEDAGEEGKKKFIERVVDVTDGMLMPRPDLEDDEQRTALFKALGRPDDPAEYEFAEVEGVELDKERKEFLSSVAHELGLSKQQLKHLDEKLRSKKAEELQGYKSKETEAMKELRMDWGLTFDDRLHMAKKVAQTFFPDANLDGMTAAEVQSFYSIGKQLGTNTREFSDQGGGAPGLSSPAEARAKIAEIRGNPEHPYFDSSKPGHEAARQQMRELYKQANSIQ